MIQLVECVPHIWRLCPHRCTPWFQSDLWPFSACCLPSLSNKATERLKLKKVAKEFFYVMGFSGCTWLSAEHILQTFLAPNEGSYYPHGNVVYHLKRRNYDVKCSPQKVRHTSQAPTLKSKTVSLPINSCEGCRMNCFSVLCLCL